MDAWAIEPKVERSNFNEGSLQSLDGLGIVGNIVEKEEKDASMPFMRKPTSNEEIGKVKKIVELKCEVLKLTRVHMKQFEGKKKGLQDHLHCIKSLNNIHPNCCLNFLNLLISNKNLPLLLTFEGHGLN